MYCSYITIEKEPYAAIGGSAMPARHPHRLARKRGMPSQRTPGQPSSFSAHSVPSVAEHPSEIRQCLNAFLKKQTQKQNGEIVVLAHNHPSTHPTNRPASVFSLCLDAPVPWPLFRKNKPNEEIGKIYATVFRTWTYSQNAPTGPQSASVRNPNNTCTRRRNTRMQNKANVKIGDMGVGSSGRADPLKMCPRGSKVKTKPNKRDFN